jgi:putative sporulation protein YtaF
LRSAVVVTGVCTVVLTVSVAVGGIVSPYLTRGVASGLSFAILTAIGLVRLFDCALKSWIRGSGTRNRRVKWRALGVHFLLEVYADPKLADLDDGGSLSPREAALLACALSLDGVAAGFGAGAASMPPVAVAILSAAFCALAIAAGQKLGGIIAQRTTTDISPIGGALLILLAILKL